jgi:hypothetical protein
MELNRRTRINSRRPFLAGMLRTALFDVTITTLGIELK